MSKKDRKLCLKVEYVHLDFADCEDKLDEYNSTFTEDFREELAFLQSLKTEEDMITEKRKVQPKVTKHHPFFQTLYRSIAKIAHPDLNPDGKHNDLFKRANAAYEAEDWVELITIANELRMDLPEFPEDVHNEIEQSITKIEAKIKHTKSTISWVWGENESSDDLKHQIRAAMGIDPTAFELWRHEKNLLI